MKKTTKKDPSKARKKAIKDLEVKASKGGSVRGGPIYVKYSSQKIV